MSDRNSADSAVVQKINERFEGAVVESYSFRGETTVVVDKGVIVGVCEYLRDEKSLRFNYLSDLCGVDMISVDGTFQIVYHLYSLPRNDRLRLKVSIQNSSSPSVQTVTTVWPTANWHEREVFDMFGIDFIGHPDMRRILMPDDFVGHPLRKDYPVNRRQPDDLREVYRKDYD